MLPLVQHKFSVPMLKNGRFEVRKYESKISQGWAWNPNETFGRLVERIKQLAE